MNVKAKKSCETDLLEVAGKQCNEWVGCLSDSNPRLTKPPNRLSVGTFPDPSIHILRINPQRLLIE